jgi:hypothetical protein
MTMKALIMPWIFKVQLKFIVWLQGYVQAGTKPIYYPPHPAKCQTTNNQRRGAYLMTAETGRKHSRPTQNCLTESIKVATGTITENRVPLKCSKELKKETRRTFDCQYDRDREVP